MVGAILDLDLEVAGAGMVEAILNSAMFDVEERRRPNLQGRQLKFGIWWVSGREGVKEPKGI